jgi:hypothetical protein
VKRIVLQAGHLNTKENCDPALRTSTGAGGEVQINTAVRDATALLLEEKGIEVKKVDANFNCDPASADVDWDLFLAIHGDADYQGDEGSGFCDFPEPSTDGATEESQRLAKEIEAYFFPGVDINIKNRSNANTRYYYMWKALSAKTPCVLIEMGQVKDPHDSQILLNTNKVAGVLAKAILLALRVENATEGNVGAWEAKINELSDQLSDMRDSRNTWRIKAGVFSTKVEELTEALKACDNNRKTITDLLEGEMKLRKEYAENIIEHTKTITFLRKELTKNKPLAEYTAKELIGALFKKI